MDDFSFPAGLHKEDKQRIKHLLYIFLADIFYMPRGELSDDEGDQDDEMDTDESEKPHGNNKDKDVKPSEKEKKTASSNSTKTPVIPMVNGTASDSEKEDTNVS